MKCSAPECGADAVAAMSLGEDRVDFLCPRCLFFAGAQFGVNDLGRILDSAHIHLDQDSLNGAAMFTVCRVESSLRGL